MQLDVVRDIVDLGDPSPDSVQGQARYARVVPRDGHKVVHRPPLRQCRDSWDEMSSGGLPCIGIALSSGAFGSSLGSGRKPERSFCAAALKPSGTPGSSSIKDCRTRRFRQRMALSSRRSWGALKIKESWLRTLFCISRNFWPSGKHLSKFVGLFFSPSLASWEYEVMRSTAGPWQCIVNVLYQSYLVT